MSYQGWTNYETWNIALWVGNEEPTYRAMCEARPFTPQSAKAFCRTHFGRKTRDDVRIEDGIIDWEEIADHFNAE